MINSMAINPADVTPSSIRERLLQATPEELRETQRRLDPVRWASETAKIMLAKGPLTFQGRDFMVPVYRDLHNEIVIIKGAQMGFSTMSIIRTLWALTTFPLSVIYTFPTRGDVSTFTAARINPIIASSVFLSDRIQDFDSVGMKQFARVPRAEQKRLQALGQQVNYSTVYFNGAQNPKDATSIDADLLIHDEEDRSDHQTIEEYQSRLYASKYKWLVRLSTPTYPGAGIDRQWKRSDMRHWLIRCSRCNERFEMDFPQNIEPHSYQEVLAGKEARYMCHKCGGTLSEEDRGRGIWVAERPTVPVHGYSISQMSASWVPARMILEQEDRATFKGAFWNLVMAKPYQEGTSAMTRDALLKRQDPDVVGNVVEDRMEDGARGRGCTMGVDVGKYLDVVIGTTDRGRPRVVEFKRLSGESKWDDLSNLMVLYGVVNCVVDADPEDHMAHVFARKWAGRVWRCRYSHGRVKDIRWDDTTMQVTPPRTEILTRSSMEILTERILPKYDGTDVYDAFIAHHVNSKKVPIYSSIEGMASEDAVDKERGIDHYEWRETGPDHFFHASTYEMLARIGYQGTVSLPSVGIVTIDRSTKHKQNTLEAQPVQPVVAPMLLTGCRRGSRRRTSNW